MTKEQIQLSIETEMLQLKSRQRFVHYLPAYLLILFSFILIFSNNNANLLDKKRVILLLITLMPLLFGILIFFRKKRKLRFKIIESEFTKDELLEIVKSVAKQFDWSFSIINEDVIIAESRTTLLRSGELITILFDEKKILINSICSPNKRFSASSLGWNRLNKKILIDKMTKKETANKT